MATTPVSIQYNSKKKTLGDVQNAFARRMVWSHERHNNVTGQVQALTKVCDDFESWFTTGNSNATIAVGYVPGVVLIATQGFTFNKSAEEIYDIVFKYYDFDPSRERVEFVTTTVLGLGSSFTGIHAEMMIVRWLVMRAGIAKLQLSGRGVVIATASSKGCCPNCAGWLNMYSIPHTSRREKLSGMWRHPITLNKYEHSTVDPYTHAPKLSYSGFAEGTATINKGGKVLTPSPGLGTLQDKVVYVSDPASDEERNLLINIGVLDDSGD